MPIDALIAKKYAQAFYAVFPQAVTFADLTKLEQAQIFLQTHKRTLFFLQLPQFDTDTQLSMIEDLIGYFLLPHHVAKLFLLLLSHNRSFYIPDVLSFVIQLYKERNNIIDFSIISSHELDEKNRSLIKQFLEHSTDKTIMGNYTIDTSLIAGIRLQSIGYMWEYSVRKQINSLRALAR
jgi:ATP synthase F1 delta subunit